MPKDPAILAHQEWLGYVQPTGLVVSIPALVDASAFLNRNYGPDHQRFLAALPQNSDHEVVPEIPDFVQFAKDVLNWDPSLLNGSPDGEPVPADLEVNLETYNETLRPKYALKNLEGERKWLLLVDVFPTGTDLDQPSAPHDRAWQASPQARFEKLLRQTGVGIGLLVNGREIRLVYAPEKELSGYIIFKLAEMVRVAGRPMFAALRMLLDSERLYSVGEKERLPAILANSRKYQNVVSTQLAEQVLEALYEMLRGFQAANDQTKGELLRGVLARDPDHVYHGLLTTLLRLVFVLYAEDRGLLSTDPVYSNYYSVRGLYERLRADAGRYTDTMDQRHGAWAQLLALFRLIYSGGSHGAMKIPAREGYLFDPDRYLFLEGRQEKKDKPVIPRVADGVVYRVLSKLLLLDGERLSYRTLAVEQVGSVYQAIMGFTLQVATGRSIAIRPAKKHGAPATINLEELLNTAADKRSKRFTDETDQKLTGQAADALKSAATIDDLLAALERKIAKTVTPVPVPEDAMVFQPSDERRKSGSHYTPSSLTGPIVEAALEPVLKQLGPNPTPAQILNLKVCDLAMGSAAFLVEACRQLGDALAKTWHAHKEVPPVPTDEDESLYAQRLIAQRCLYGLDKNQMAADLAKLSLWLTTLAKDHPFTFLDHSLRHGDALVGFTRKQIESFNWAPTAQQSFLEEKIRQLVEFVSRQRRDILEARENTPYAQLEQELAVADDRLSLPRMIGNAAIAAFFSADKPKQREEARKELLACIEADLKTQGFISVDGEVNRAIQVSRRAPKGVTPFHWELEFPEVFTVDEQQHVTGGFDTIVGNPPFMGGKNISGVLGEAYLEYLAQSFPGAGGQTDLCAYFYRQAFKLLSCHGTFGLVATNTISQGDTRSGGLLQIRKQNGTIYRAVRRLKWPGLAAVTVSIVHITRGQVTPPMSLDGRPTDKITAFLYDDGSDNDPPRLAQNAGIAFTGGYPYGSGFLFDDSDPNATPTSEIKALLANDPRNGDRIRPYLGGEEMLVNPTQTHSRFVIDFGELSEEEARKWPDLMRILEEKVKPERLKLADNPDGRRRKTFWWRWGRTTPGLDGARAQIAKILMHPFTSSYLAFALVSSEIVVASPHVVIIDSTFSRFATLQSRIHEVWTRFFASSLEDRMRYTPSDCFETFPFPQGAESKSSSLHSIGQAYYQFRANLMVCRGEGLTKTYNRFHDPEDSSDDVLQLRELHARLDRTVLEAYGWADIEPTCEFIPEFEDEDEEVENGRLRKKKYRYRWPDEIRDEVLARLLKVNRQRALEEGQLRTDSAEAAAIKENGRKKKHAADAAAPASAPLFASQKGGD